MALDTTIMVILICAGCALGIAGLVFVGLGLRVLIVAARKAGIQSTRELQVVMRKIGELSPQLRELQRKQAVVAERLQGLSATTHKLTYLRDELDRSTGGLSHLKS
jgi:hypothetical protein